MSYTIKATRTSVHIDGIPERTKASAQGEEANTARGYVAPYAQSACGALTRSGHRMEQLGTYEDIAEAIKHARFATFSLGSRKVCATCQAAAEALLAES